MMTLREALEELSIDIAPEGHHHVTSGWVSIDCPFCSPESGRYRLGINERNLVCSCYTCGVHSAFETLKTAASFHSGEVGGILSALRKDAAYWPGKATRKARGKLVIPSGVEPLLPAHIDYIKSRNLDYKRIVSLWGVQGIGPASELPWRLFIPVTYEGNTVSWTTRTISDKVSKRYHAARPDQESISARDLLYGEDYCRNSICVNEGHIDVWTIGPGAVATGGVGYSKAQLLRMSKYPIRIIAFDNQLDAQARASKLVSDLSVFDGQTYNVVWSGKDANSSPRKDVKLIRRMMK